MSYTNGLDKPSDYFETKLWSGNATDDRAISGLDFAPNWVWIKNRTDTNSHAIFDTVRGATKYIESDTTDAEATGATFLKSFTSDGFTLGTAGRVNANSQNYVSWNWKAGTSVSGNTGGSGTAKTYTGSVNTDAGFSIIRYIGNGTAGHTIPHHLGTTPAWIICRTISASKEWDVYHHKLASSPERDCIVLNTDAAAVGASTAADKWNNTLPTSSVVTLGDSSQLNTNDGTCIMYAFAEKKGYSKFGSYTGNGNADGTFVYLGFKPAWVMIKKTNNTEVWLIMDSKRQGYNPENEYLIADLSNAEGTPNHIDLLSNGFKLTSSGGGFNSSGDTFIYQAFAENPFVTSSGVPTCAR